MKRKRIINLLFLLLVLPGFWSCEKYDIDSEGSPKFVTTDFIELEKITRISKFRSGSGHDFSDDFESCRSMKHYYSMDTTIAPTHNFVSDIYAPISGKITRLSAEQNNVGNQIQIRSDDYPAFTFMLMHVVTLEGVREGDEVTTGQLLGTTVGTDIAVEVRTPDGKKLISYFDVMTDSLFVNYQMRGISDRSHIIISKEERDANPIECEWDQTFPNQLETFYEDWVFLN